MRSPEAGKRIILPETFKESGLWNFANACWQCDHSITVVGFGIYGSLRKNCLARGALENNRCTVPLVTGQLDQPFFDNKDCAHPIALVKQMGALGQHAPLVGRCDKLSDEIFRHDKDHIEIGCDMARSYETEIIERS